MWRFAVVGFVVGACGRSAPALPDGPSDATDASLDGLPLASATELAIVAHQDDDLLFMQPDMFESVSHHRAVTIVYVTAGDAASGVAFATARINSLKISYAMVTGASDWSCGWIAIADHVAQHCRLGGANLSLVFLGYPDGGVGGELPGSLAQLWAGAITGADTVADQVAHYDRDGLVATVTAIVETVQPQLIRTLEIANTHGADHSDHAMVGALAVVAIAAAGSTADVLSYRGYDVNFEPATLPAAIFERVSLGMRAYEACLVDCGVTCGEAACPALSDPRYVNFLHRRYAVGIRKPPFTGILRMQNACVIVDGAAVTLGDCAHATPLAFEPGGNIRVGRAGHACLEVEPDERLALAPCGRGAARDFLLDDEGHVWSGKLPRLGLATATAHSTCLVVNAATGGVGVALCGSEHEWRWELLRTPTTTTRAALGLSKTGRAVRLGDLTGDGKADLCAIEPTGLMCAAGDGAGGFAPAIRIDPPGAPLAIEPESLVLGDVDGDGRADACGRTTAGILCATSSTGFASAPWSSAFARTGGACPADRSLAIVDASVCGILTTGIGCTTSPTVLSSWPGTAAPVWPGDLDNDGHPDWCSATPQGLACSLASDRAVTTEGVSWAFSIGGVSEGSMDGTLGDTTNTALADITGDGRPDACVAVAGKVRCAIGQGHGFGPRTTILALPTTTPVAGLWLGDLDGDGKADACVDTGAITCALTP